MRFLAAVCLLQLLSFLIMTPEPETSYDDETITLVKDDQAGSFDLPKKLRRMVSESAGLRQWWSQHPPMGVSATVVWLPSPSVNFHAALLRFLFGRPLALRPFLPPFIDLYWVYFYHVTAVDIPLLLLPFHSMFSALSTLSFSTLYIQIVMLLLHANYDGLLYSWGIVAWLRMIQNGIFHWYNLQSTRGG